MIYYNYIYSHMNLYLMLIFKTFSACFQFILTISLSISIPMLILCSSYRIYIYQVPTVSIPICIFILCSSYIPSFSLSLSQSTFHLSLLASGSTIDLVDQLLRGKAQNGMAIIRPPGHHAMKAEFNGYCYFNNVALAAQHALDAHKLQRILIIDYDVHHGQGTQRFFYNDAR